VQCVGLVARGCRFNHGSVSGRALIICAGWSSGNVALLVALFLSVSLILLKLIGQLLERSFFNLQGNSVSSWDLLVHTTAVLSLVWNSSLSSDLVRCEFLGFFAAESGVIWSC